MRALVPVTFQVASDSHKDETYMVTLGGVEDTARRRAYWAKCTCPGFRYRRNCWHSSEAVAEVAPDTLQVADFDVFGALGA